jgi:DNA-directed RNA polymerase subunit RPC12/RpoP
MTVKDDEQGYYYCGKCRTKIFYLLSDGKESAMPCPDCDWNGAERKYKDIKFPIKMDLNQF